MKKIILIFYFIILNQLLFGKPKMITISNNNLNIQMSETVITLADYKEYILETGNDSIEHVEHTMRRIIDEQKYIINDDLPVWGITWLEAAKYCNWISEKEKLIPCYIMSENVLGIYDISIKQSADGYRMPYVSELIILSGLDNGLSKEKFDYENTNNIKIDPNNFKIKTVLAGKKNSFGLYDLLGNITQFCNDFYNGDYNYFNYQTNFYGPEKNTIYSQDDNRCYFGGMYYSGYEDIKKQVIYEINENYGWSLAGIRLVRELNPTFVVVGKKMTAKENLRIRNEESTSSIVLLTMEKGTLVKILKKGSKDKIDNINSYWVQVEIQKGSKDKDGKDIPIGTIGWCYGGYLE